LIQDQRAQGNKTLRESMFNNFQFGRWLNLTGDRGWKDACWKFCKCWFFLGSSYLPTKKERWDK